MALVRCDFFSDSLSLSTSMTVILPQRTTTQIGMTGEVTEGPPPVLYLLHGLSDDDTTWLRRTSIERYAASLGLAVVMPQVHRSFYADEAYGGRYWTFVSEELPELVSSFFRLSDRREDTFVAGLSMGGYGAFKLALRQPERFAAAACLSGAVHLSGLRTGRRRVDDPRMFERVFGDDPIEGGDNDLFWLLDQADPAELPALFLSCGTEDALYADNAAFGDACGRAGVEVTTMFGPGDHTWDFWDARIQDVLGWLPLPDQSAAASTGTVSAPG
jgi:putative tributyrin esterase